MTPSPRKASLAALAACLAITSASCNERGSEMLPTTSAESPPEVDAPAGLLEGRAEGPLRVFKGIPYAEPPVGAQRWKPPIALPRWSGTRKAVEFGAACAQPEARYSTIYSADLGPTSEDCLTLNIWAPTDAKGAGVFVWIHGGAMTRGSSKEPCTTAHASPNTASWWSRSIIGSACSATWRTRNSARSHRSGYLGITVCSIRSRPCDG